MTANDGMGVSADERHPARPAELSARDLMFGIAILGLPLVGPDGVAFYEDTSGPSWAASRVATRLDLQETPQT